MIVIESIELLPPLAYGRIGPSRTPCESHTWGPNDLHPRGTGKTTISPASLPPVHRRAGPPGRSRPGPLPARSRRRTVRRRRRRLLDLADHNYAALLGALHLTFGLGDAAGGLLLEQSRRAMRNLHETNQLLAARGVRPRFALPAAVTEAAALVADLAGSVREAIDGFRAMEDATERAVALRQAADNEGLVTQMLRLTDAGARD